MRDTLGAPLEHEGDPARIWRYVNRDASAFQLPGVWLSADELYALMLAQQVLQRSGAGLLGQARSGSFMATYAAYEYLAWQPANRTQAANH